MRLLVFAHRGEAKAFLDLRIHKRVSLPFGEFFQGKEDSILITGEGGIQGASKLSFVLGRFPEIKEVFNLGLGGGLSSKVKLGDIYPIRTLYGGTSDKKRVEFRSFSTGSKTATMDLISAPQRVLSKKTASFLENFAPIVDREGYHFAQVCKMANIPFYAAKIISDLPYQYNGQHSTKDICRDIQRESRHYSTCLLEYYRQHRQQDNILPPCSAVFPNSNLFYLTATMERQYGRFSSLLSREKIEEEENKLAMLPQLSKKERGRRLLQSLFHLENPLRAQIEKDLDQYLKIFWSNDIQAQWTNPLESTTFVIKANIDSFQKLETLINTLVAFDYDTLEKRFSSDVC